MKRLRISNKKQVFFWGLLLVTCLCVTTIHPVAAQNSFHPFSFNSITSPPIHLLQEEERKIAQSIDTFNLVSQGKIDYDAGRLADAIKAWQEAAQNYQQVGDRINQALSLHYLSLAYQDFGQWQQAEAAINQSLDLLQPQASPAMLARVFNTKGSLQLAMGQPEAALETWKKAENFYSQAADDIGVLGSKINQAQAWQSLGMFQRSRQRLESSVQQQLNAQPDSIMKVTGLRSLGIVWEAIGDLPAALRREFSRNCQLSNHCPTLS